MSVQVSPAALADLREAVDWYETRAGRGVASQLVAEFERLCALVAHYPAAGRPTDHGRRLLAFRTFPYKLVFRAVGTDIRVVAVAHERRHPGAWQPRF